MKNIKWYMVFQVALVAIVVMAVLFSIGWVFKNVRDQSVRCISIGAKYDGPGICKFTEERWVPTP